MKTSMTVVASVVLMVLVLSLPALAGTISLVPDSLNVAPGETVNVSVVLDLSEPITMIAISAAILYDPLVFTYVDPVAQGGFLTHDWSGGSPLGAAANPGELRIGGIDWTDMINGESLAAGSGTLFTFTLRANATAALGPSALTWGITDGTGQVAGFDYGTPDPNDPYGFELIDVVLPSNGTSINVASVPEPSLMLLLGLGLGAVTFFGWRWKN